MNLRTEARERCGVHGVVLVDKPLGITSQTAVTRVKHLYGAAKAGHTGTLDPMAGGLLPICLGEATKFSQGLIEADKTYVATLRLGLVTRTGDLEGEVLACQIVDGQPAVARFNRAQYANAKELASKKGLHIMDALSEVGLSDPAMMRALKRLERKI